MTFLKSYLPLLTFFNDVLIRHMIKKHTERHTVTSKPNAAKHRKPKIKLSFYSHRNLMVER
jgi:hypothetical protein